MPVQDFRAQPFDIPRIERSGKDIGRNVYHKLYCIENLVRIIVHSVLSVQIGAKWWKTAVDTTVDGKAQRFRNNYVNNPWHSSPGKHDIFYIDLKDLNEIIRANQHLFQPLIPDIDQWIARIEQVRLPRNIVAHMNWPTMTDRKRVDVFLSDLQALAKSISSKIAIAVPT